MERLNMVLILLLLLLPVSINIIWWWRQITAAGTSCGPTSAESSAASPSRSIAPPSRWSPPWTAWAWSLRSASFPTPTTLASASTPAARTAAVCSTSWRTETTSISPSPQRSGRKCWISSETSAAPRKMAKSCSTAPWAACLCVLELPSLHRSGFPAAGLSSGCILFKINSFSDYIFGCLSYK